MGFLCNADSAIKTCDSSSHYWHTQKKKRKNNNNKHKLKHTVNLRRFSYSDLESATNGFSPRTLLGKGSHGAVYKAALDGGAVIAAVKRPTSTVSTAENEIEILSKIRTRRIVNLIGYAVDSKEKKLLLVVEYMPNGSLYDLIHKSSEPSGWSDRVRFGLQVAKAIEFIHGSNPPVIHRDIKSSNVLIDRKGNARVSDFGLALSGHVDDVRVTSTPPAGTLGYLDPGYLAPGDVSTKSDVFSFGILLLEIISGRRAIDVSYSPPSVIEWALPKIKCGSHTAIFDCRIGLPADLTVCRDLAVLAARCVRSTAEKRPGMDNVVDCLERVHKRLQSIRIWTNLRRRVRRVESVEEQVRNSRRGSLRSFSNGELSSAASEECARGSRSAIRSKSIGSFNEIDGEISIGSMKRQHVAVKNREGEIKEVKVNGNVIWWKCGAG